MKALLRDLLPPPAVVRVGLAAGVYALWGRPGLIMAAIMLVLLLVLLGVVYVVLRAVDAARRRRGELR